MTKEEHLPPDIGNIEVTMTLSIYQLMAALAAIKTCHDLGSGNKYTREAELVITKFLEDRCHQLRDDQNWPEEIEL